jgi:protein involved in polysaccharide export with SLBB domain
VDKLLKGSAEFRRQLPFAAVPPLLILLAGCNSIMNGWLDVTALGTFDRTATMEIRTSLSLEDTPSGIPGAVFPSPEDLLVHAEDYPIAAGDTLAVEIYELRLRQVPFQAQVTVSSTGYVNLPVLGRVHASGLTVPELEAAITETLQQHDILRDPEVTVNDLFLQSATYSIFGIGVSAANDAPLRAGTFPIRRPDLRVLEAINQVGGLNEFVTDVYVFRNDEPPWARQFQAFPPELGPADDEVPAYEIEELEEPGDGAAVEPAAQEEAPARSPEQDLIDAVVGDGQDDEPLQGETPNERIHEELEPDPTQPYIFMNGQFVPNPVGTQDRSVDLRSQTAPRAFDTAVPTVNWARIAGETGYRVIRVSADLLRSGDPNSNIVVRAGDVIRIVSGEIGEYYVMGQVNRVGPFRFNAEKITLKSAIAAAGGLSTLAWPDRCTVYRRLGQREQMIQVDLDRIFAGKDPDFYIKRGDIINVGTHPFAPFLRIIRDLTLPNPVSNAGYSFTYSRNFADIDSYEAKINPSNEPDRFPALFP